MNSRIRKSLALAALLAISGVACAQERAVAVNTEGMAPFIAARVQAKAQQGATELRRFAWRTRTIYALDLRSIVREEGPYAVAAASAKPEKLASAK